MSRTISVIAAAATLLTGPVAADPSVAEDWRFTWDNGFELVGPGESVVLEFGGRIMSDWAFYSADEDLEVAFGDAAFDGGTEFRRARLFFAGELHGRVEFKAQYDFAGGDSKFRDVFIGLINLPGVGGVRVGHYKEPFSLEELTSSKYITFMERSLPIEAFSPGYNAGIMLHDARPRFTWAAGLFKDADDFGDSVENDDFTLTGRFTAVPWRDDDRLIHLGAGLSRRQPLGDEVRFRSRPESHLTERLVSTETLAADEVELAGAEVAAVFGPASVQSEYVQASVDRIDAPEADFGGYYVTGSWFVTGESRPYKNGSFGRVKPIAPLGEGVGAWEVAVRYSTLDLDDAGISGGELEDVTLGVNWYLYDNVRTMVNYVLADRENIGELDAVQLRFQIDF